MAGQRRRAQQGRGSATCGGPKEQRESRSLQNPSERRRMRTCTPQPAVHTRLHFYPLLRGTAPFKPRYLTAVNEIWQAGSGRVRGENCGPPGRH